MAGNGGLWEVRPLFELSRPVDPNIADRLVRTLRAMFDIVRAGIVIEDRGTGLAVGVDLVVKAPEPSDAVRLAILSFERAAKLAPLEHGAFREATVRPAGLDPRT